MKYIKLIHIITSSKSNEKIAECIDVPLNKICVSSLLGTIDDDGKMRKIEHFTVPTFGRTRDVFPGVIYQVYLLGFLPITNTGEKMGDNGFRYVFDAAAGERVLVSDLNATSFAELILKLELRGMVYSTDDAMPDVPEALKRLDECKIEVDRRDRQLESLREEIAEKNKALDRQAGEIAELMKKPDEQSGSSSPPGKKTSWWKRSFESMFGSEDDPSWES